MAAAASPQPILGLVRDVVVEVIEAIGDELSALAATDSSAVDLRNGRPVAQIGTQRLWSFELDVVSSVPPETPGRLLIDGCDPVRATVLAVGDFDIVLGVDAELGETLPHAALSVQPWFILDALRDRLTELLEVGGDVGLAEALLDLDEPAPVGSQTRAATCGGTYNPLDLSREQLRAAVHASRPGLRFVWGPPGTGKTSTLAGAAALLAHELSNRSAPAEALLGDLEADQSGGGTDRRVLVVAHANAAVDVAMARIADALDGSGLVEAGRVLRVGTPHLPIVRERPEILPDEIIARDHPQLVRRRDELEAERRALSARLKAAASESKQETLAKDLESVRAELAHIGTQLRDARAALIRDAAVVGATLSKLVLDDLLWRLPTSAVIVDEASMSGLPFLLATALRGASTLACFGDFRQLPPIAVSERQSTRQWFGRDVFEVAGVLSRFEADEPDGRLAILHMQHRMGETISSVVGKFAYFDLLHTHPAAAERARDIAALPPAEGVEIVVIDTSSLATSCLVEADPDSYSRVNLLTAALTTSLAHLLAGAGATSVGVVAPYRAQARLLEAALRGLRVATAATTHRFQGSERDVVIVDLADAEPQSGPSRLTGRDPELALRLLNVGVSRAKGKLLVVADLRFLTAKHPTTSPARSLIDLAAHHGAVTVEAEALIPTLAGSAAIEWVPNWPTAAARLVERLPVDPTSVDVNVATEELAGPWLDHVANRLPALGHSVTIRAPVEIALDLESSSADLRLRTLGPAPIAFGGETAMAVGSADPAKPAACITDEAVVVAARRRLLVE
ncbi:MAG TPA: AAA domain-containing protein [Acidimicrobiales bacterium]